MDRRLLVTKFHVPLPRPNLVLRPRLIEQLNEGLNQGHQLTLVSAPAGFGKTTLVADWIERLGSERQTAWLSVDEDDNDPVHFINLLIAALQQGNASIAQTAEHFLHLPQPAPLKSLCTALINDISTAVINLILVLDDYHLVHDPAIHEIVGFLIEHQPTSMHTLIITREEPPLPTARLRVRNQLTEIREQELRFTAEEASVFFSQTMKLHLAPQVVESLGAQTEGWIAGLQLAALAVQAGHVDAETVITTSAGSNRYVVDYLATEVFQRQPDDIQNFLQQTAILDRFSAAVCDHITNRDDSQSILDRLEAANLFLVPLDHQRAWYRYNRLFAEFLRTMLDPSVRKQLHLRAMNWYETNGYLYQAIHHAFAADAPEDAQRLILQSAETVLHSGRIATLVNWLDALPEERVRANFDLATYRGWTALLTGQLPVSMDYASTADSNLQPTSTSNSKLGRLLLLKSYLALAQRDYDGVVRFATQALSELGQSQLQWRIMAFWSLAEAQERTGSIADVVASLHEARQAAYALGTHLSAVIIDASLASALNEYGQRDEAAKICEQAMARYVDNTGLPLPIAAVVFGRMALLEYERNRLDLAREYYERFDSLSQHLTTIELQGFAQGILARILAASGQTDAALKLLKTVREAAPQTLFADLGWLVADEVNLRLREGDSSFGIHWAEAGQWSPAVTPQYLRIDENLAYARCLLAQNQLAEGQNWLARLEEFTQKRALRRRLITVYILQAFAAGRSGDLTRVHDRLSRALKLAAPRDYVRAFLDEDNQVLQMLAGHRYLAPAFVDKVLNTARAARVEQTSRPQQLTEPLSERELEVLGLIAAGLSNSEIGERLVIADGTVKRHINHIYAKLAVRSRTQAIVRAHELALLS